MLRQNVCRQCETGQFGGNKTGLTACYSCPYHSDTGGLQGAVFESSCGCSVSYFGNAFVGCHDCPLGGSCTQFNLSIPNTAPGWWRANSQVASGFIRCDPPVRHLLIVSSHHQSTFWSMINAFVHRHHVY
jgi:hypothetical protein